MAAQAIAEDQLLELLLTLKRTTSNEAKTILNSQPQIAYALMAVMADIGAVKMEVVQEALAKYGALPGAASVPPAPPAAVVPPATIPQQSAPAIPPHMQSQVPPRGATPTYPSHGAYPPPQAPPTYPAAGYRTPPPGPGYGSSPHAQNTPPHIPPHAPAHIQPPPPHMQIQPPHAQVPPAAAAPPTGPRLPDAFAALPEEQKGVILRVMQMSREEVYAMPPSERENIIKLRATLGLPT
ncbi:hypothetical protein BC628DRAFT_1355504 [Trametes gibbosa]|nr:hypothetical protein BC628DRAFT_1355504 [Trametes gibbosa]